MALAGFRGGIIAPGCIREALGLPSLDGSTTSGRLVRAAKLLGLKAWPVHDDPAYLHRRSARAIRRGRYAVLLGWWQGPGELHWVLLYSVTGQAESFQVADPWPPSYRTLERYELDHLASDQLVVIGR